jgi:type VI secretion system protein ImpF
MRSLLDRLLDDEPDTAVDPPSNEYADFEVMRLGLRRDLEALLNTRRPYPAWIKGLEDSVVGFGLPDVTAEDFSSSAARARIARAIAQCIRRFEPRLLDVEVECDPNASPGSGLRFRIRARLRGEGAPVEYGARLRPIDRNIQIESGT